MFKYEIAMMNGMPHNRRSHVNSMVQLSKGMNEVTPPKICQSGL